MISDYWLWWPCWFIYYSKILIEVDMVKGFCFIKPMLSLFLVENLNFWQVKNKCDKELKYEFACVPCFILALRYFNNTILGHNI